MEVASVYYGSVFFGRLYNMKKYSKKGTFLDIVHGLIVFVPLLLVFLDSSFTPVYLDVVLPTTIVIECIQWYRNRE